MTEPADLEAGLEIADVEAADVEVWFGPVEDTSDSRPVVSSTRRFEGAVVSLRSDEVDFDGYVVVRDVVEHPGAVGVIALDERGRVLLLRQYRHPVQMSLFEPPAGLLDVPGEEPLATAQRELLEEAGLVAATWVPLLEFFNSPGGSSELLRVFLAMDLQQSPGGRVLTGEAEEASLPQAWVPLGEAVRLVLSGKLRAPIAIIGILGTAAFLAQD